MPILKNMILIASTSRRRHAASPMYVNFEIEASDGAVFSLELPLPSSNSGETKVMTFPDSAFRRPTDTDDIQPQHIVISTDMPGEDNAWLPQAMYVLAQVDTNTVVQLASIPEWPTQMWLSANSNDHRYPDAFSYFNLQQIIDASLA